MCIFVFINLGIITLPTTCFLLFNFYSHAILSLKLIRNKLLIDCDDVELASLLMMLMMIIIIMKRIRAQYGFSTKRVMTSLKGTNDTAQFIIDKMV